MRRKLMNVLLLGALTFSTGCFTSCEKSDIDDLKDRMSTLEAEMREYDAKLASALSKGLTVVSKEQDANKNWTVTFSDGSVMNIEASSGIEVQDAEDTVTFILGDKSYKLVKDGHSYNGLSSLVWRIPTDAEYATTDAEGYVTLEFKAMPAPTAEGVADATFKVVDTRLTTRAEVPGLTFVSAELTSDGFISVKLTPANVIAGSVYSASLEIKYNGFDICSNYFMVKIGALSTMPKTMEGVNAPIKVDATTQPNMDSDAYIAEIPTTSNFNEMDFAALYSNLPTNCKFELAPEAKQNPQVKAKLGSMQLSADGKFKMTDRLADAVKLNSGESSGIEGILVYVKDANEADKIVSKVYWKIIDPVAASFSKVLDGVQFELSADQISWLGASSFNLYRLFLDAANAKLVHNADKTTVADTWKAYSFKACAVNQTTGALEVTDASYGKYSTDRPIRIEMTELKNNLNHDDGDNVAAGDYANYFVVDNNGNITTGSSYSSTSAYRLKLRIFYRYDFGSVYLQDKIFIWVNRPE